MSKLLIFLTKDQVIQRINNRYKSNIPQGMKEVFDKLHQVYDDYCKTGDIDTLRYQLALCIRAHHGHRMPWASTRQAVNQLIAYNIFNHIFDQFSDLYLTIQDLFKDIPFAAGPLMIYDTALNIGQLLSPPVEPDYDVYLNAGAWEGAKYIMDTMGGTKVDHIMPVSVWKTPNLFPDLDSKTIEDILCIYKRIFEKLAKGIDVTETDLDEVENPCLSCRPRRFPSKDEVLSKL